MPPLVTDTSYGVALEALLRELVAEVKGLRQDLAQHVRNDHTPSRADHQRLARLLPAIAGVHGSDRFAARDLFDDTSPALRLVTRGLTPRETGKLLRRSLGHVIDGYLVEKAGEELGIVLWRVMGTTGNAFPAVPPRPCPPGVE